MNVGVDLGYGFLKVTDGSHEWIVPSVVGTGRDVAYHSELTLRTEEQDNLVVEVDHQRYFVGSLAVRQSGIAVRSLAENRPADPNAKILFLAALGLVAGRTGEVFNVVTGLPTMYYGPYRDDLNAMIMGDHRVTFHSGGNAVEKLFTVDRARIIPQPFGTVYDAFLDRAGNVENEALASSRVGVIDIGFRTCDFVVSDRLEYIERLSFSTSTGLSAAYGLVADGILRQFRIAKTNYELDGVMSSGILRAGGRDQDITGLRDDAYRQVADKVVTEAQSVWSMNDLDAIYITGGGGKALAPFLVPHFENVQLADSPQVANVHGFWKLANKIFASWAEGQPQRAAGGE